MDVRIDFEKDDLMMLSMTIVDHDRDCFRWSIESDWAARCVSAHAPHKAKHGFVHNLSAQSPKPTSSRNYMQSQPHVCRAGQGCQK